MWSTLGKVLTSSNAIEIIISLIVLVVLILIVGIVLSKYGMLNIHTKHVNIGAKPSERELIRRQIEAAYGFISSIEGKIITDDCDYNVYFTRWILERIYDKVVEWIMFNHITTNQLYIKDKQDTILNLVYALPVRDEFKTPEFKVRVENWVKELIEQLVNVKVLYGGVEHE